MIDDDDDDVEDFFSCRVDNVKTLYHVLSSICVKMRLDNICYVEASQDGLVFSVFSRSRTTLSSATLQADLFDEYTCEAN